MMPGMNPRQMKQMMRKMGIQQTEIDDAQQVIIKCPTRTIIITHPQVSKVNMMGQDTYQIVGEEHEEPLDSSPDISEDDIETVMQQAECTRSEAQDAINDAKGDLAAAILALTQK
ncbi:MAG: nascent polypeptide-associated complex protein [Nanoarchaeota archaeon]